MLYPAVGDAGEAPASSIVNNYAQESDPSLADPLASNVANSPSSGDPGFANHPGRPKDNAGLSNSNADSDPQPAEALPLDPSVKSALHNLSIDPVGNLVVGSYTLVPGSSVIIDGQTISWNHGFVTIDGYTLPNAFTDVATSAETSDAIAALQNEIDTALSGSEPSVVKVSAGAVVGEGKGKGKGTSSELTSGAASLLLAIGTSTFTAYEMGTTSDGSEILLVGEETYTLHDMALMTLNGDTLIAISDDLVVGHGGHTTTIPFSDWASAVATEAPQAEGIDSAANSQNGDGIASQAPSTAGTAGGFSTTTVANSSESLARLLSSARGLLISLLVAVLFYQIL